MTRRKSDQAADEAFLHFQILMRHVQHAVSPVEWSVLCFVYDRTWGWSKRWERIPYRHFVSGIKTRDGKCWHHGTGLSRSSVIRGLKGLEAKGMIFSRPRGSSREWSILDRVEPPHLADR